MNIELIHKALANPLRRQILVWMKAPREAFASDNAEFACGVPVSAIRQRSGLAQSTVSAHIALLVEAGLLRPTRVGQWSFLTRDERLIRAFAKHLYLHL
ncbi:ArsR/SmtB family transcription factor [Paraburkholderia bannensis]|uniref:ArsR/SmtB family transcription factor n=1 Tax=Paraburkholderia bannensis TaxID=765414 RepID=UPI002ABDCAF4|nr:helix-turn-helix domain-containing protein [Paraburkholderia bannensis]